MLSVDNDMEQLELRYIIARSADWHKHSEKVFGSLYQGWECTEPSISIPKDIIQQKKIHFGWSEAVPFMITPNWKLPNAHWQWNG